MCLKCEVRVEFIISTVGNGQITDSIANGLHNHHCGVARYNWASSCNFGRSLFLISPALSRHPWHFHSTKTILFHRKATDSFHQAHSIFPWEGWNDVAGHAGNPAHIMKCPLFSYSTWCWWCVGRCISACASAHSLGCCSGAWLSLWEGWSRHCYVGPYRVVPKSQLCIYSCSSCRRFFMSGSAVVVTCKARFCKRSVKYQMISSEADVGDSAVDGLAGRWCVTKITCKGLFLR